ncbi:hypothetical protein MSPP1_000754 [Malassezia sp. CBS 17886]|nr:hypothetical protein MSPP1_000754 [Malassezia sp. CBS 17886]
MTATDNLDLSNDLYAAPTQKAPLVGVLSADGLPPSEKLPRLFERPAIPRGSGTFTLKNRAAVSPMCMYSSKDGFPTPFHLVHYGQFALHGAGTVTVEASAVAPEGRISSWDLGIYKDEHVPAHASVVSTMKAISADTYIGLQIAHAGRKASTWPPYDVTSHSTPYIPEANGGWSGLVAPSATPYGEGHLEPKALSVAEIKAVEDQFVAAAARAFSAGYDFVEVHSAHGYLLSEFSSPLVNTRTDEYGGPLEHRMRLLLDIVRRVRAQFPDKGLWVRINGTDAVEYTGKTSWTIDDTKRAAVLLNDAGVDVLDVSSGGTVACNKFDYRPGYQDVLSAAVKSLRLNRMLVSAVGVLQGGTEDAPDEVGTLAERTLQENNADLISIARGFLKYPNWVQLAVWNLTKTHPVYALQYGYAVKALDYYKYKRDT